MKCCKNVSCYIIAICTVVLMAGCLSAENKRTSSNIIYKNTNNGNKRGYYHLSNKKGGVKADTSRMYINTNISSITLEESIFLEDIDFGFKKIDGKDVAILANGDTVRLAIQAAEALAEKGIEARVYDFHTIKPLDEAVVNACIDEIGKIITVEDHNILNGLGSAVCELVAEAGKGKVKRIGIQDQFGQSAPYERLLAMNGVTVENIVAEAEKLVRA